MITKLLSVTPNASNLIYASARQCYSPGWVGDIWEDEGSIIVEEGKEVTDKEITNLVRYLRESGHTSVLEHVKFTFAIDGVSRSLTHQLVRHRIASYSQQSQRYVDLSVEFSIDNFVVPPKIKSDITAYSKYLFLLEHMQETYNSLVSLGIDPEDARYVMPNSAKTRIVLTMNCVALLHFFGLRCCTLAQWEIRNLANSMMTICKNELSIVFKNSGSRCNSLGYCPESKSRSCGKFPVKLEALCTK